MHQKKSADKKANIQIKTWIKAVDEKHLMDFMFYEIGLPRHPILAYVQKKDRNHDVAQYLKKIRLHKA